MKSILRYQSSDYIELSQMFELAGSHRLMSRPDTCLGIRTHLSICGGREHFIFRLMYV